MNLKTIQKIINSNNKCDIDLEINKITTNSKEVEKGDVFLAINSGYIYIDEAISKGALAVITDKKNLKYDVPVLVVNDSKRALKSLASFQRAIYKGKVVAITGSNGKTTTKELLKFILEKKYKVLVNPESKNNILGISNTLLQLNNQYDILIVELGMNHKGEISELSSLVKPDMGIITNIGTAHIGYLGNKDNIFKAKMEILEGNQNMLLFVNGDDEYLKSTNANLVVPKKEYTNVNSINASLAHEVAKMFGYSDIEIDNLINNFKGVNSRMEKHIIKKHLVIDDAYNASYEAFVDGLKKISEYPERKIIVFGDMLELGSYSVYYHQKVLDKIKEINNTIVITFGKETSHLNNRFHFYDLDSLKEFFYSFNWNNNDLVYLKGSHKLDLSSLISFFRKLW